MGYIEDLRAIVGHRPLILVGSVAVIIDEKGRLLLQQRKFPKESWGLSGGLMELGETTEDVARREVMEETGLKVGKLHFINVYSGSEYFVKAENGDEFYCVTVAYYTNEYTGELNVDKSESIKFEFFYPDELPQRIVKSHKKIIDEYLSKQGEVL
jgi:8-oxo-dGTP pyrophosphatase MutT (NUDIX family)